MVGGVRSGDPLWASKATLSEGAPQGQGVPQLLLDPPPHPGSTAPMQTHTASGVMLPVEGTAADTPLLSCSPQALQLRKLSCPGRKSGLAQKMRLPRRLTQPLVFQAVQPTPACWAGQDCVTIGENCFETWTLDIVPLAYAQSRHIIKYTVFPTLLAPSPRRTWDVVCVLHSVPLVRFTGSG